MMSISTRNTLTIFGLLLAGGMAIVGFRLWQSWSNINHSFGATEATSSAPRFSRPEANPANTESVISPGEHQAAAPNRGAETVQAGGSPDLNQQALELHRELRVVLAEDPELLASLDELFDEPNEEALRENLELLREAFLADDPDL